MKRNLWKLATIAVVLTALAASLAMLLTGCGPEPEEELTPTPVPVKPTATPVPSPALSQVEGKAEAPVPPPVETEAGILIDDFESGDFDDRWWSYADEGTVSFACTPDQPGQASAHAIRLTFEVGADGYVDCGTDVEAGWWGDTEGLSFSWRADRPGLTVIIVLDMEDPTQTNPEAEGVTPFQAELQTPGEEWTPVTLTWDALTKAEWVGESGVDVLDPTHVVGLYFEVIGEQGGSVWFDDLQLMAGPEIAVPAPATPPTDTPVPEPAAGQPSPVLAPSNIAQVWANDGGDKVTRDELRATNDLEAVHNSVWDGTGISLLGARNEVVAFNLVLEAPTADATNVGVTLTELTGPNGATITTRPASGDDVFNYVGRDIELFYVRYLEIKGLSTDLFYTGYNYDERHIPERCRRPYNEEDGEGSGSWEDRPCHNKLYPDIAVPLELHSPFTILAGTSQSIWGDIYTPKTVPAGVYTGVIAITEDGALTWQIPISVHVRNFTLPDLPNARTMLAYSPENVNDRYLGEDNAYPEPGAAAYIQSLELIDRHFQLAHRHKISLIDGDASIEQLDDVWTARLSGELFTPARGYEGVGVGVGNNVYSIGTYGSWAWQDGTQEDMWANTDAWVNWFDAQAFTTPTDYFLYLIDESDDCPQIEQWARWMEDNPGPGQRLMSMATIGLPTATAETPSLDVPTSWYTVGLTDVWQNAADSYAANPDKRFYMYNSNRPGSGSFAIEDQGVALRELAWGQYKMGIDRWFYWESTYYNNDQGNTGQTNVFQQAQTYGDLDGFDNALGDTGWNYLNGDGVLFYPGTDTRFPEDSYGVMGPFASLRLKHWRRGIQDVDYLTLAAATDPERTADIVSTMIPQVLWECGASDPDDPTWVLTDISWSTEPDVWEAARAELADIIESASP